MRVAVMGTQAKDLVNFRGHLLSEMARAGHVAYGIAPEGTPEISAALERLGATFVPIAMDRTGLNPFAELGTFFRLWRLFRKLHLDLLLTYELKSVVFGTLAARCAFVPRRFAMITGRGTTLQGEARGFRERMVRAVVKRLYRLALPRTHGVLFQNQDDCSFFVQEGMLPGTVPRKIIHGSGVDLDYFARAPLPDGPVTFLFLGRLLRNKGLHEFVEASRILSMRNLAFRCRILGALDSNPNGITGRQLEAWVKEGAVEYLGEARDVRPVLAAAHVLVLPSYGEGTPRSVLEAMSMGRAVVTTDAPGCRETVVEDRNGFLVPVGDVSALANAMEKLAVDPALIARFGGEGRKMAEQKYDVRLVTADILSFLGVSPHPITP
ncbi:MAG: glycosyltransferase family 4 protein [Geothrix sp.]|nr:glycosyltransferase family 4 protein [Geothrix sp.]